MSLIKCRKCGGPHVTLKCGKDKQDLTIILDNQFPQVKQENKPKYEKHDRNDRNEFLDKRKIVTVKISNLPDDITVEELNELISEWGKIGRINVSNYEHKSAFIDFYYKEEAHYFIKALDKTPFDHLIIDVEMAK
jgi:RNA recognition motif-containing protein